MKWSDIKERAREREREREGGGGRGERLCNITTCTDSRDGNRIFEKLLLK